MQPYNSYLAIVNRAIERINLPDEPRGLYDPIRYSLSAGGKRLRPVLALAVCDALDRDPMDAIHQAVAVEVFHNFTLLHDDVMDNAEIRRGLPTVCKKWNDNTAILSGDAMLTLASQLLQVHAGERLDQAARLFNATAMGVYEGQQYDMDFETRTDVSLPEYVNMIRLKTGVLLGCAAAMGAVMADVVPQMQEMWFAYGENLGMAFQLQDDYLDTFGDPATFGKAIGGDILNDKKTFLSIRASQITGPEKWQAFTRRDLSPDEKIRQVTAEYIGQGLKDEIHNEAAKYVDLALDSLTRIGLREEDAEFFVKLARSSAVRES